MSQRFTIPIALVAAGSIYAVVAMRDPQPPVPCSGSPSTCQPRSDTKTVYIAIAATNDRELKLAQNALYLIGKHSGDSKVVIDILKGAKLNNLFSQEGSRRSLQEISSQIKMTPPDTKAVIQAFSRMLELAEKNASQHFYAYILTLDTSDPTALAEMRAISVELAKKKQTNLHLHIIGLDPSHRLEMSKAIAPIDDYIKFSSASDGEWNRQR